MNALKNLILTQYRQKSYHFILIFAIKGTLFANFFTKMDISTPNANSNF